MKFFCTVLFLFVFEFANAQVPGMPLIMNPLVRKLSLDVTTSSSTTANFVLKFASSHTIIECGVIFSYNNNATISNNQGKWVAATNFNGGIDLSNNITHSFVYAPYYATPYFTVSNGTYYGSSIQFTPNWATVTINGKLWAAANLGATMIATNAGTNSNSMDFIINGVEVVMGINYQVQQQLQQLLPLQFLEIQTLLQIVVVSLTIGGLRKI
jgi:hypothetical protein